MSNSEGRNSADGLGDYATRSVIRATQYEQNGERARKYQPDKESKQTSG